MPIYFRDLLRGRLGAFAVDRQPEDLAGGGWDADLFTRLWQVGCVFELQRAEKASTGAKT